MGFKSNYDFLKTLQLLPKFITLSLKSCGVKDQTGYAKAEFGIQKKISTVSLSCGPLGQQYDIKMHLFKEVFENITEPDI